MSTTVDQQVVEMRFDNKNFEQNVANTLSTLDKLKQKLRLDGASKGLENVDSAARNVNMSPLGNAVETVRTRFSALEVMGVTALANITNSAVNTGKRMLSALTIDPVKTGFSEYETKIGAIQTIMSNTASKGTTMEDVTRVIGELNTYADKTIYNFAEMTRNIGTFTAAGVGLEDSASAIQGIANLAAASGSTSQQASTAMYQLSQALAAGQVKLMDWNSVVNAGMGGEKFQEALKATAREHGVAVDKLIKKNGSFRESLQEGWISSDILNETLKKFTVEGATEYGKSMVKSRKWTQAQADALVKEAQAMEDAATKVKTFTQLWDTLKESAQSGWSQTWEIIVGDFEEAKETLTKFSEVIGGMLEASANARNELLQGWKDAGGRADLIDSVYNVFEGIMSFITPIKEAFREIFPPTTVEQLVGFTKGLKELTSKLKLSETTSNNLKRTFKGLFAVLDVIKQVFVSVFKAISPLFGKVDDLGGGILDTTAKFGDWLVNLNESIKASGFFATAVEKVHKALDKIASFFKPVIAGVKEFGASIGDVAVNASERLSPLVVLGNAIKGIFVGIGKIVQKVAPYVIAAATGIGKAIGNFAERIGESIRDADYDALFDIVSGGIMSAIGIFIAKFIKSGGDILDNAGGFLENINGILGGVGDALGAFTKSLQAETLKKIATAIAILAASLLVLSLIDSEKLMLSLTAITTLFAELMTSMSIFGKITEASKFKGITKIAAAMVGLSAALLLLSVALKIMSTMSWSEMGVGLISMTVGLGALVIAVNNLPETKVNKAAKAIKKLSSAIVILAVGIKIMSTMSWSEMAIGLITMVTGLGALVAAVNLLPKDTALRVAGMVGLATAMVVLAASLKIMATMSWSDIARSLVTLSVSLGVLAAAMAMMKKSIPGAIAMSIIAPALVILAGAMKLMGGMSWEQIAKGLVTLAGSLLIISGAMAMMKNAIPGAAALLVVSASLAVLTPVLLALGAMPLANIGKSLLMLAGVFTVIGLAGLILKPLIPTILGLSGAIALLGVACAAIGAGVFMIGVGLTSIAAAGAAAAVALTTIVSSIIALIPYLIEQIGVGIIKFCEVIGGGSAAICEAVTIVILSVVDALVASVPALVDGCFVLIDSLLKSLVEYTPSIVASIFDFLIVLINSIAEKLPDLIKAGVNLLMAFFSGVIEALKDVDPNILVNGIMAVGMMTALVAALAAIAALVPAAMVGVLGLGVVIAELGLVLSAIGALAQIPGLTWLVNEGGKLMQSIGTAIGRFIGGIIGGISQGISAGLPQLGKDLSEFMTNAKPFINGARLIDSSTLEGVKSLAGIILTLTAADILRGLTSWFTGGSSIAKFGKELEEFGPSIKAYADSVSGIDGDAVSASANAAKALAEMSECIPNQGGVAAWFAGEKSVSKFGEDLITLGQGLRKYSNSIAGFDSEAVIASTNAAKALANMTDCIPNEGGMVAWFAGDNSISKFGDDIVKLGESLTEYSDSIVGFDSDAVIASANAAKALVKMTDSIPNSGGMVTWFTGDNSISKFGDELVDLGECLSEYSDSIAGFDAEAVIASANAAKAITSMASSIPNSGGMVTWFTGDNSIARFGYELILLGEGLKGFSDSIWGINASHIEAAAKAAKSLAEMTAHIPNSGGMVTWFTGDNSIAKFGREIVELGEGLMGFSREVEGINAENVTAAANAGKALAEMTGYIPEEGGIKSWFTGDRSIAKFGNELIELGAGLMGFSTAIEGINANNITAASNAAKALAEMTSCIPNEGGISAWFTGEKSVSKFGDDLIDLGVGIRGFSTRVEGINVESVTAAANAAQAISEMTKNIPNEGGVQSWFSGEKSVSKFSGNLVDLGAGISGFAQKVEGINAESVTAAANAAKALAEITKYVPNEGGMQSWFSGEKSMSKFSGDFVTLGEGLMGFATEVEGINAENVTAAAKAAKSLTEVISSFTDNELIAKMNSMFASAFMEMLPSFGASIKGFSDSVVGIVPENITAATNAAKTLSDITSDIDGDGGDLASFGANLVEFGKKLNEYFANAMLIDADTVSKATQAVNSIKDLAAGIDPGKLSGAASAISDLVKSLTQMSNVKSGFADDFCSAVNKIAKANVQSMIEAFNKSGEDMQKAAKGLIAKFVEGAESQNESMTNAGKTAIEKFIVGIDDCVSKAEKACAALVSKCVTAIKDGFDSFESAGSRLVDGFASGISANSYKAAAKARAMARAAANAAEDELDINSPSRVGYGIGDFFGLGFVNAIGDYARKAYRAGAEMADQARSGLNTIASKLYDAVNADMDVQPTIRPVLDLRNVRSGASAISSMLGGTASIGVTTNVGAISSMMSQTSQNGSNSDVIAAINKLRKDLANVGGTTYNINGVTYDDGSNIRGAIEDIVRYAKIERRV